MSCLFYEPHKLFYSQIKYCILLALTVHIHHSFRLEVDGNKTWCDAVYVCMCVCVCIYIYIYIYTHTHYLDFFLIDKTFSRIDYIFLSPSLISSNSSISILPILLSDHSAVLCSVPLSDVKAKSPRWRFNISLLSNQTFITSLKNILRTFLKLICPLMWILKYCGKRLSVLYEVSVYLSLLLLPSENSPVYTIRK